LHWPKPASALTALRSTREHHFVFGNRVLASALVSEQPGLGPVCERVLRGYCQGLVDQRSGAFEIGAFRVGRSPLSALHEHRGQSALCLDRPRIERQRTLEQADGLGSVLARRTPENCRAAPKNVVERIGVLGWPRGLPVEQLYIERNRDPAGYLVLEREDIAHVAVEALSP